MDEEQPEEQALKEGQRYIGHPDKTLLREVIDFFI